MTNSDCGWSILTSISGGKANMPLCIAFCWILLANSRICPVSAVEARTNSTGNWPPPGSAGGVTGNIWMPGMACSFCCTSGMIWKMVRLRSSHGLTTMPPKPELGKVIWKVKSVSGTPMKTWLTAAA